MSELFTLIFLILNLFMAIISKGMTQNKVIGYLFICVAALLSGCVIYHILQGKKNGK